MGHLFTVDDPTTCGLAVRVAGLAVLALALKVDDERSKGSVQHTFYLPCPPPHSGSRMKRGGMVLLAISITLVFLTSSFVIAFDDTQRSEELKCKQNRGPIATSASDLILTIESIPGWEERGSTGNFDYYIHEVISPAIRYCENATNRFLRSPSQDRPDLTWEVDLVLVVFNSTENAAIAHDTWESWETSDVSSAWHFQPIWVGENGVQANGTYHGTRNILSGPMYNFTGDIMGSCTEDLIEFQKDNIMVMMHLTFYDNLTIPQEFINGLVAEQLARLK